MNKPLLEGAFAPLTEAEMAAGTHPRQGNEHKVQSEFCDQYAREREALPICPPDDAEPGAKAAARLFGRQPDDLWRYATKDDATAFYVSRWNDCDSDGVPSKTIRPLSWTEGKGWQLKAWPELRPLYNLPDISEQKLAPVVVCEGEKAADAAARVFSKSIVTTSSGGSNAAAKSDWQTLAGRKILIWPDADEPGLKYANQVAAILAELECSVSIIDAKALALIDPNGSTREPVKGWDAADAVAEWANLLTLRQEATRLAKPLEAKPAYHSYGRYEMSDDGLSVEIEKGKGENTTIENIWIASPFEIIGLFRDPKGRGWGKWLRWRDADGRLHLQHVPDAALQGDPASLCAGLVSDGLRINRTQQRHLATYLSGANVKSRVTIVSRTGWHEIGGQSVFVLAEETIGPRGAETVILDAAAVGPYEARGTLKEWHQGIGKLASGHALPVLTIATALAGPLLHLAEQEGGGLNIYGGSSKGKTTVLQAGASVWGRGASPGYVRAWRATANGLEGAAASATDTALVLDELGMVEARDAASALYGLSNGSGKARAGRDGSLRESKSWRVLVLSTGEVPVETKLAEDKGRKARAGQLVRMLDIPADRGFGFGAFDNAGIEHDAGKLAKAFKQAAVSAFGTAGPEFVRRIIAEGVTGEEVRAGVSDFVAAHVPSGADGQIDRAAHRLGLIAVAGELATSLGVTPWLEGEARAAAAWALAQWIDGRGGTEPAEVRQAIEQVRLFIEQHGDSRFEVLDDCEAKPVNQRVGWRKGNGSERVWLVPRETWKADICAGLDADLVRRTLSERGMVLRGPDGLTKVEKIAGRSTRVTIITASIFDGGTHDA